MPPKTVPANARGSNSRTAEYTITECLLLCKAWISTSEDKVKGADQKKAAFNEAFSKKYHYIKKVQEKKETLQKQRLAQARTRTLGHESEEDEEIRAISVKYPNRTVTSLSKKKGELWRLTKKWLAFEKQHPRGTGENDDEQEWFDRILPLFHERYNEKFDKFIPIRNYLRQQPVFIAYMNPASSEVSPSEEGMANSGEKTDQEGIAGLKRPHGTKKEREVRALEDQRKKIRTEQREDDAAMMSAIANSSNTPAVVQESMGLAMQSIAESLNKQAEAQAEAARAQAEASRIAFLYDKMTAEMKSAYIQKLFDAEMQRPNAQVVSLQSPPVQTSTAATSIRTGSSRPNSRSTGISRITPPRRQSTKKNGTSTSTSSMRSRGLINSSDDTTIAITDERTAAGEAPGNSIVTITDNATDSDDEALFPHVTTLERMNCDDAGSIDKSTHDKDEEDAGIDKSTHDKGEEDAGIDKSTHDKGEDSSHDSTYDSTKSSVDDISMSSDDTAIIEIMKELGEEVPARRKEAINELYGDVSDVEYDSF